MQHSLNNVFLKILLCVTILSTGQLAFADAKDMQVSQLLFKLILVSEPDDIEDTLDEIGDQWDNGMTAALLEVMIFTGDRNKRVAVNEFLKKSTGKSYQDVNDWYRWLWNQEIDPVAGYAGFKASLFRNIDPRFEKYFDGRDELARIRLDEIRWGGVRQDGIPPLRNPEMIAAAQADYLEDDNIVFGMQINGDARAYPKRILAWHEMFTDTIGGVDIAGVYCTLCGTVIPYRTENNGTKYQLGTSGFLYRSNKLMYDQTTQSLWSTSRGEPVLGPLVDKGIKLEFENVVTTTWGEWKRRHPQTTVLSLNTGHSRDYGEGVAYNDYFSTDRLMFNTPFIDKRLKNKREILALRFAAAPNQQLAIDTKFLNKNNVYHDKVGAQKFVVLTDKTGANRVFDPKDITFANYDQDSTVTDNSGKKWNLSEDYLETSDGNRLASLPAYRAFWFGWRAAFPETKLIK